MWPEAKSHRRGRACPRPSTPCFVAMKDVDARHKAGHDEIVIQRTEVMTPFDVTTTQCPALRRFASTLVRSAATSLRICSIAAGRFWISCGSAAAAAVPTGGGVDRAKLDAPSAPASAPNAAAKATVAASRANRLARADAVGV